MRRQESINYSSAARVIPYMADCWRQRRRQRVNGGAPYKILIAICILTLNLVFEIRFVDMDSFPVSIKKPSRDRLSQWFVGIPCRCLSNNSSYFGIQIYTRLNFYNRDNIICLLQLIPLTGCYVGQVNVFLASNSSSCGLSRRLVASTALMCWQIVYHQWT